MRHILHYIYILVILILLSTNAIYAKADLTCPGIEQKSNAAWEWNCPEMNGTVKFDTTLSDLDVGSGAYTCEYRYPDTQQVATVCSYVSKEYREDLNNTLDTAHKTLVNMIKSGTGDVDRSTFAEGATNQLAQNLENFASDPQYIKELDQENNLYAYINKGFTDGNESLSGYFQDINNQSGGYLYKLHKTKNQNHPNDALAKSYSKFVKPYIEGSTEERNETFSHFVTALVTLDQELIKGYDDSNGSLNLDLSGIFKTLANTNILQAIKNAFMGDLNTTDIVKPDNMHLKTWKDVFGQKIWGFYYNLQSRLDIGYDIISTQLLFIMMVFFSVMMAARGGARYIINRENGESSGEVKINEASIMKTLGILATVFAFYISVPYEDKSSRLAEKPIQEIRTNASLSKIMIRMAMDTGADFGTMISDLGTDAFLRYVVQQQGINNGLREGENVIKSVLSLVYYYPAYEIVNLCRYQTGLSDDRILSGQGSVAISSEFSKDSEAGTSSTGKYDFYEHNHIALISDSVCQKMILQTENTFQNIYKNLRALLAMIHDDKFLRLEATYNLVDNHIKLQQQLGWMNIASIPYTYFMMKNQNLFYESRVDYAAIAQESEQYARNLGLRGGQDAIDSTLWIKNITQTQDRLKLKDDNSVVKQYTRLAIYNFLPGFSSIRNEVLQRIQSLFSDILRMGRSNNNKNNNIDITHLNSFNDFLNTMMHTAVRYYGDAKKLFNIADMGDKLRVALQPNGKGNAVVLHQIFYQISYLVAMAIWKSGFIIVFLSAIAMIVGIKIVLYIINIMVHFFISPFIVVWAFATSPDGGATKIKNYLRDTLIYMLYPTIIVIGVFMFIFAYELFYSIYGFITSMLIEGQTKVMENAALTTYHATNTDVEMGFLAVHALKDITEILIDLLSVYVAFLTINKFPELVLKMMGVGDSAVIMLPQSSEAIQSKGGGSVNPLSR